MRDASLRIVGSVLGLRRFTVAELVRASRAGRSAVAAWLRRHKDDFERTTAARMGGRGRPHDVWTIRPEAEGRLRERISALSTSAGAGIVDEPSQSTLHELDALDRAEDWLGVAKRASDGATRADALEWYDSWASAALAETNALERSGTAIVAEVWKRIATLQIEARRLGRSQAQEALVPTGLDVEPYTAVRASEHALQFAREFLAELEVRSVSSPGLDVFEAITMEARPGADVRTVGALAALGLLPDYPAPNAAKESFANRALLVEPRRFIAALQRLASREAHCPDDGVTKRYMVAVCAGIGRHPGILAHPDIRTWFDRSPIASCRRPSVVGAWLHARLLVTDARLGDVLKGVEGLWHDAAASVSTHPDLDEGRRLSEPVDGFATAERTLHRHMDEYFRTINEHRMRTLGKTASAGDGIRVMFAGSWPEREAA